jgi:signal transduction histidine kinase/CheY-like chemotaxis protein
MLSKGAFFGLRRQSALAILLLAATLSASVVFVAMPRQESFISSRLAEVAERSLRQLAASISSPILTGQYAELYESIDAQLAERPAWRRVRVVSGEDVQLYPLDDWAESILPSETLISTAISVGERRLGTLDLVVDFEEDLAIVRSLQYRWELVQLALILTLLLVLQLILAKVVVNPIDQLMAAFKKLADANYDHPLPEKPNSELGVLMKAFEEMRDDIAADRENLLEARSTAEKANRAKSAFLASMSHELRTPLNAILGITELCREAPDTSEEQKEHADRIYSAGSHLLSLINNLLDHSAIESGNISLKMRALPVESIIDECASLVAVMAAEQQVEVSVDRESFSQRYVNADYTRLKQVFFNLLSNAVKYNQPGGHVSVFCESCEGEKFRVVVEDDGRGLSEEAIEKLFTPFERLGAELSDIQGTGIGLVITRELIEMMDGKLGVKSQEGQGSRFWVEFCAIDANTSETEEASALPTTVSAVEPSRKIPSSRKLKLLVAEDNALNRHVLELQIAKLGHDVAFANDGEEAWLRLQEADFDVLLTDIKMPKLDGVDLIKRLRGREAERGGYLPAIAVTANVMKEDVDAYFAAGADGYLAKPVMLDELRQILTNDSQCPDTVGSTQTDPDVIAQLRHIDLAYLKENFDDDPALFCEFFKSYIETAPSLITAMKQAQQAADSEGLAREAHSLKSISQAMGVTAVAALSEQLERLANENANAGGEGDALLQNVDSAYDAAEADMQSYIDGRATSAG